MRSMEIDRRTFLFGAAVALAPMPARALGLSGAGEELFASTCQLPDGHYGLAVFDLSEGIRFTYRLPSRGHDVALSPDRRRAVVFARRPGTFAAAFDLTRQKEPQVFSSPADRHFYGHGTFSPDGRLLYATENDFDGARGIVGIYDPAAGYRRIGEFFSGGVGPHELVFLDERRLIVANGGIETHPATGRQKLNLSRIDSSLCLIDPAHGEIQVTFRAPEGRGDLSIRHMGLDANADIWIGCQSEGPASETPPLVGRLGREGDITLFSAPDDVQATMRNYIGDVAVSRDGMRVATSAPRGNRILVWDLSGNLIEAAPIPDSCGITASGPDTFIATRGDGAVNEIGGRRESHRGFRWDNHVHTFRPAQAG